MKAKRNHQAATLRALARKGYVQALQDGRRERAVTFTDRRKEESRKACRRGNW